MADPMGWGSFMLILIRSQLFTSLPYPTSDFSGQTIIITGSNTGLGLEAARHIVRLGAAKVILAVRTIAKGEAAAENIIKSTKATKNTIEVWPIDLSDYDSIKRFAARAQGLERLDALVQNAGILTNNFNIVAGEEAHIAINVVGAVLLGLSVLPKLKETAKKFSVKTRLSFVGSDMQYVAQFKEAHKSASFLDSLRDEKIADMEDRYPTSKLLLLYAVREIAARSPLTADSEVIINYMTPGACQSDLFRDDKSWLGQQVEKLAKFIFARTTEVGGRALVDAIKNELPAEAHGAFLMDCKITPPGTNVDSEEGRNLQEEFNKELFGKLERISPGITKVLA